MAASRSAESCVQGSRSSGGGSLLAWGWRAFPRPGL